VLEIYRSSVSANTDSLWAEDRHPHAGGDDRQAWHTQDLAGLVAHLDLFAGMAVADEDVDLRQALECDLVRIDVV
jgi:hypothetical protein